MFGRKRQEAKAYEVYGHQLRCPICQHDLFTVRRSLLGSRGLAMLDMEWASRSASTFVCAQCGHMLWFANS